MQEEREEAELTQRWEQIKAQKEMLSIETQLAAADAKIKVYDELDGRSSVLSRQKEKDFTLLQLSTMGQKMLLMERSRMMTMKLVMTKEMNLQMTRTTVMLLHSYLDRAHTPLEVKSGMYKLKVQLSRQNYCNYQYPTVTNMPMTNTVQTPT